MKTSLIILKILVVSCILVSLFVVIVNYTTTNYYNYIVGYAPSLKSERRVVHKETTKKTHLKRVAYKHNGRKEKFDLDVFRFHPNLPEELVSLPDGLPSSIPILTSIRWTGTVYQESWKDSPKFLLYSANFDSRIKNKEDVRILGLYDSGKSFQISKLSCLFWYKGQNQIILSEIRTAYLIDDHIRSQKKLSNDLLVPFLLSCRLKLLNIGSISIIPFAVSLVKEETNDQPTNVLKISGSWNKKVISDSSDKGDIKVGVCGKALFYYNEDFSTRLVEWIEIMRVLGVSKIIIYKTSCHRNVERVLEFYERQGFVQLISFYYPPPYVHEPTFIRLWSKTKKEEYRGAQKMYINDCLFRFKDEFDYLGVFDPDEIPILKKHETLPQFFNYIRGKFKRKRQRSCIFLKWKQFYTNLSTDIDAKKLPEEMYILRHNLRSVLSSKEAHVIETTGKSFYDTRQLFAASIHSTFEAKLDPNFKLTRTVIHREDAYMGHFGKKICARSCAKKYVFEEEKALLKHKDQVLRSFLNTTETLGL